MRLVPFSFSVIFRDYAGEIPGIMRALLILPLLMAACVVAEDEFCYENVLDTCRSVGKKSDTINCNAKYGAIDYILPDLQKYVNTHITRSYEYLLMSTHYANFEKNRAGFEKVLRELSDSKWETAIELIKYITKRGGKMDFGTFESQGEDKSKDGQYELYELETLAKALDIEKRLALKANQIHREATGRNRDTHDPEISHYLEEAFAEKQAGTIRKLAGYTADLNKLLREADSSLALYMFDDYLTKQSVV